MSHHRRAAPFRADTRSTIVDELVAVLAPHPGGLRRWSVMNTIRRNRAAVSRDIPLKLEADVERTFRQFCAGDGTQAPEAALFCRPGEKAGEVWALNAGYKPADQADQNA